MAAARYCIRCGNPVTTGSCPNCGAVQPETPAANGLFTHGNNADSSDNPDSQPWHPFEQPSWEYPDRDSDPTRDPTGSRRGWTPATPTELGPDFMGVSQWQTEPPPPPPDRTQSWLLGSLAAVAVVAVLGAIAFLFLHGQGSQSATPDVTNPGTTAPSTPLSTLPVEVPSAAVNSTAGDTATAPDAAATTVTVTTTESTATEPATAPATEPATTEPSPTADPATSAPAVDPLGGPVRDIACATGYIVQIASAGDEAGFTARVAELRAAGQLPADAAVAHTGSSCQIFAGQSNSVVLYAGPYPDPYAACPARLGGAPDSFIKGTTPETARQYVSCLCPAQVATVPTYTAVGQTGVWVGELQRILANKLNVDIPDLQTTWGTFSQSTSDAVKQFQTANGLPATGQVGADTWQALQKAQC